MNGKISISVAIAFGITFLSLFLIQNSFPEQSENNTYQQFFSSEFDPNMKKILIFGSSHIGHLNIDYINNIFSKNGKNIVVYNLAQNSDTPERRIKTLNDAIPINPKIVFYSVSYLEFEIIKHDEDIFPLDIQNNIKNSINKLEIDTINPKLNTLKIIRGFLKDIGLPQKPEPTIFPSEHVPFFPLGELQTTIANEGELRRDLLIKKPGDIIIEYPDNIQVNYFKEIIKELQNNDVQVVIFIAPLHKTYLENVPENTKNNFDRILNEVSNEFDVKIYDFSDTYADLPIWNNSDHVAYNDKSIVFSDDIAKMIMNEVG